MPITQTIPIDLNTRGANPVAFTHQGDTARSFVFEVYNNGEAFSLTGYTAKIAAMLPADNGYQVIAGENMATGTISDNTITATLPAEFSAKPGNGVLTIILTGSGTSIRPINVDFRIQKSADAPETIAGASDFIPILEQYIAEDMATYINAWLDAHPEAMQYYISGSKLVLDENGILSIQNDTDEIVEALDLDTLRTEVTDLKSDLKTINEYYFNSQYVLKKTDLKQGYFSQGQGFITTGGEAAKYLVYTMTDKLYKGSLIKVVSDKWFCAIDVYADGNWNASSAKVISRSYAENFEFTLPIDGYVAVTFASAPVYAQRTAISASDYSEDVALAPLLNSYYLKNTIGNINFGTVSEFLFDGCGTLSSDNFEQGYMSNGTGWISTGGGDSLKYITFRNHIKLHKGTKVNIDCATLYCAIDLYADDNWNASSVRLDHVDYMQSTSYKLPSDGYLCLTVSTSNIYSSRTSIAPSDFDEDIKIYPKTESGTEVNTVLYEGEKIDVARHYCQAESYMTMTHASTRSMQGGACYGDYFFQFMDKFSGCAIYDLSNKSLIQLISLTEVDTYHCNNANFGAEFYDESDAFPLLYVSMENIAEHKVNVYRVTNVNDAYGLTLVQTITWDAPSINSVYYPNAVIDTDNNHIIQIGYSTNSYQASNSNKIKVNIFDLPMLSAGDITLTDSDKIDSFILPSLQATQGAVCHNGKIIQAYGLTSDYQIRVIDLTKKQFVTKVDLTNATISAVVGTEQEAVFIYGGNIFCSNVDKKIWKLIV